MQLFQLSIIQNGWMCDESCQKIKGTSDRISCLVCLLQSKWENIYMWLDNSWWWSAPSEVKSNTTDKRWYQLLKSLCAGVNLCRVGAFLISEVIEMQSDGWWILMWAWRPNQRQQEIFFQGCNQIRAVNNEALQRPVFTTTSFLIVWMTACWFSCSAHSGGGCHAVRLYVLYILVF